MDNFVLSTGQEIPALGLGTWDLRGKTCTWAVKTAIGLGYRHIDTALMYGNHTEVGQGIRESGLGRRELFVTSKVWPTDLASGKVLAACDKALKELKLEYLDLFLIHWPSSDIPMEETLGAFSRLVSEGKVKDIGVSNFTKSRLNKALEISEVPITVNQVEYHPYLNQEELLDFCKESKVLLTAYCPIARGRILKDELLRNIAGIHGKTPAQVTLRWLFQKGIIAIPKASSEGHMKENMDIFDWELTDEEMQSINNIPIKERIVSMGAADFDD